jgi:hypothetical protein
MDKTNMPESAVNKYVRDNFMERENKSFNPLDKFIRDKTEVLFEKKQTIEEFKKKRNKYKVFCVRYILILL